MCACVLSCIQVFEILWTVAHQAPLPWNFPGKNTGADCHILLQGIFLTLGLNLHLLRLLNWQVILYQWYHLGSPNMEPDSQSIVLIFNLCKGHEKT